MTSLTTPREKRNHLPCILWRSNSRANHDANLYSMRAHALTAVRWESRLLLKATHDRPVTSPPDQKMTFFQARAYAHPEGLLRFGPGKACGNDGVHGGIEYKSNVGSSNFEINL